MDSEYKISTVWKIHSMKRVPDTDLVFEVGYRVNMRSGKYRAFEGGTILLEGDPTLPTFVPFKELTEEQIISWVKEILGEENITNMKQKMKEQIDRQIEQTTAPEFLEGIPWRDRPFYR